MLSGLDFWTKRREELKERKRKSKKERECLYLSVGEGVGAYISISYHCIALLSVGQHPVCLDLDSDHITHVKSVISLPLSYNIVQYSTVPPYRSASRDKAGVLKPVTLV